MLTPALMEKLQEQFKTFPHPKTKAMFRISDERRMSFEKAQKCRGGLASTSLGMTIVGFVLQMIAAVFW